MPHQEYDYSLEDEVYWVNLQRPIPAYLRQMYVTLNGTTHEPHKISAAPGAITWGWTTSKLPHNLERRHRVFFLYPDEGLTPDQYQVHPGYGDIAVDPHSIIAGQRSRVAHDKGKACPLARKVIEKHAGPSAQRKQPSLWQRIKTFAGVK